MSKPVNIASPKLTPSQTLEGSPISNSPNIRALRAQYSGTPPVPNIPPRGVSASVSRDVNDFPGHLLSPSGRPSTTGTPVMSGIRLQAPGPSGVRTPGSGYDPFDDLTDEEKARVLRKHLVSREERENQLDRKSSFGSLVDRGEGPSKSKRSSVDFAHSNFQRGDSETFPIPYHTPGADLTHDIYKWQTDQRRLGRPRAASFAGSSGAPNPTFANIHEPGGFRRNYLLMRANEQGEDEYPMLSNNFIEFLYLFGHFAGEDLEEIEEEDEEAIEEDRGVRPSTLSDAEAALSSSIIFDGDFTKPISYDERSPLISSTVNVRSKSRQRRRRASSVTKHGDATVTQAVLMLLKAFVGTGVLFLGKAFYNGGILFSAIVLVFIALVSLHSFLLLVKTKFVVSGSFGDIGGALYGPYMRYAILTSIAVSQIGFVAAYTIFVSENLQAFVMGITNCLKIIPVQYFILMQLVIFLPFALIRNLAKLSTTALIADVFILAGLIYIFGSEIALIGKNGTAEVKLFNPKDFPLLIGTAVFSFEGIGLVIPITDAMREPKRFPAVLTGVMLFLTVLFGGAGVLSYLTFGSKIQTVVIVNLDSESKLVQAVQFLYSMAILLSAPLQLFPAVRIMENGLFTRSGKANVTVKWQKNAFRFFIVMVCTVISWAGAKDLDKFVAFIGSSACVPLCYVYPAMLHYKACAKSRRQKVADIALMGFGTIACIYTTFQTVRLMVGPESGSPTFGKCEV